MDTITIKADREFLREICAAVKENKYAIPVFQRDYVWKEEQVLDLFDSISKGYPIGTFILWKSQGEIKCSKDIITDEKRNLPEPEYYILDGRQRLTTFYGCITGVDKDIFRLGYNLEANSFEYMKYAKKEVISVADIYDTFKLLGKLQDILSDKELQKKAKLYIERAKQMNAILQGYTIGEVKMDNCSLDDAKTVFSRINSTGVDISRASMLQAASYQKEGGLLLSDEIDRIRMGLGIYGFDTLTSDDILNCLFKFAGYNFYDVKLKELENEDLTVCLDEAEPVIERTVAFLHDYCGVLSACLLPYTKQLTALTWFFKRHAEPTENQLQELKKWFFYTTYQKSFQNSSLANVRWLFRRFEQYIDEEKDTAIDYSPIEKRIGYDFKFGIRYASTDLLLLVQVYQYAKYVSLNQLSYDGYLKYNGQSPVAYIPYFMEEDRYVLNEIFVKRNISKYSDDFLRRYALSACMIGEDISLDDFVKLRTKRIVEVETELLHSLGIEFIQ